MKKKLVISLLMFLIPLSALIYGCSMGEKYAITTQESENGSYTCSHTEATKDTDVTIVCTPNPGYRFEYAMINSKKIYSTKFDMPDEAVTIQVFFTTITYNINYVKDSTMFFERSQPTSYTVEDEISPIGTLVKHGYVFEGWFTNSSLSEEYRIEEIPLGSTGDIYLYPKFSVKTNTITYHIDSNTTNEGNPSTYTVLDNTIVLKNPVKTDYEFKGWYSNESFTGTAITQITAGSFSNYNLYPKFVSNKRDSNGYRLLETKLDFDTIFVEEFIETEKYKLCTNIDLGESNYWTPLKFSGCFDGGNYTISNINIKYSGSYRSNHYGFFSELNGATVQNVKLSYNINTTFKDNSYSTIRGIGGVAGSVVDGTTNTIKNIQVLTNSTIQVSTTSAINIGGIIGIANDKTTISDCYVKNLGILVSSSLYTVNVAGISGQCGKVSECKVVLDNTNFEVTNAAKNSSYVNVAGIMAQANKSTIKNCYLRQKGDSIFKIKQTNSNSRNAIAGILTETLSTSTIDCCYARITYFQFEKNSSLSNLTVDMAGLVCEGHVSNSFVSLGTSTYEYNFNTTINGSGYTYGVDTKNTHNIAIVSIPTPIENCYAESADAYSNGNRLSDSYIYDTVRLTYLSLADIKTAISDDWDTTYWNLSQSYPDLW